MRSRAMFGTKPEETTALILGDAVYQIWEIVQLRICYRVILRLVIKL
jgi:hypothetical protein